MNDGFSTELKLDEPRPGPSVPPIWRLVSRQAIPIVPFNEIGEGPAIYCVHPIAGDVSAYHELAQALRPDQRFFGIQVPLSKTNAAFCVTIEAVARHHVEAVCRFQPDGPVILAGWSAGAIIALEMAQQLIAAGRDVPLLIALDGAPCNAGAGLRPWTPAYIWALARNLPGWLRSEARESSSLLAFTRRMITRASDRLQAASPSLRTKQRVNTASVLRLLDQHRSFIRGLLQASHRYVPAPYSGQVIVYESKVQPLLRLFQVAAIWRKIAPQAEIVRLNGNHASIFRHPYVDVLAEHLLARLAGLHARRDTVCRAPSLAASQPASEIRGSDTVIAAQYEAVLPADHPLQAAMPIASS